MTLSELITDYGYPVILIGTFLEGETILVIGGFAAHLGYLRLPWVILAAFAGTVGGDQLFYFLGRRHGEWLLTRRPRWKPRVERIKPLVGRYRIPIILLFRFFYGVRTVTPFALGMQGVPVGLFLPLNLIGAVLWALCFGMTGYLFGHALELILGDLRLVEEWILLVLALGGAGVWLAHRLRQRQ